MPIESVVQARLSASSALFARVPVIRIRTEGEHVGLQPPYIVHGATQERPIHVYGGTVGVTMIDYQIIICARDLYEAYDISDLVLAAVTSEQVGTQLIFRSRGRQYDVDARLWVMTLIFDSAYAPQN